MPIVKPGADGAAGLLTMRETREIFHFPERDLRRAITLKLLPITIVENRIMIAPADAAAYLKQWGRRYGK
jgi:hypothetical protein